jgi:hypothetical protein
MTVKELIEKLKEFDENMRVVVAGYEGGVDDANSASAVKIKLNQNTVWYYGKHEAVDDEDFDETAVQIS